MSRLISQTDEKIVFLWGTRLTIAWKAYQDYEKIAWITDNDHIIWRKKSLM